VVKITQGGGQGNVTMGGEVERSGEESYLCSVNNLIIFSVKMTRYGAQRYKNY